MIRDLIALRVLCVFSVRSAPFGLISAPTTWGSAGLKPALNDSKQRNNPRAAPEGFRPGGAANARRASALRRMSLQQVQHEMAQVQQGIRHAQQERPQHAQLVEDRPPCRRTAPHLPAWTIQRLRPLLCIPELRLSS